MASAVQDTEARVPAQQRAYWGLDKRITSRPSPAYSSPLPAAPVAPTAVPTPASSAPAPTAEAPAESEKEGQQQQQQQGSSRRPLSQAGALTERASHFANFQEAAVPQAGRVEGSAQQRQQESDATTRAYWETILKWVCVYTGKKMDSL